MYVCMIHRKKKQSSRSSSNMPRKRKAKKRRISSRKRRRRTTRRSRPRPKPNSPSSDEDFKVSQEEDEVEEDDDEEVEEVEEEEEDDDDSDSDGDGDDDEDDDGVGLSSEGRKYGLNSVVRCLNRRPKRPRNCHRNCVSLRSDAQKDLDEDFDVDLQRAIENDFLESERRKNQFSCPRNVSLGASSSSSFRTTLDIAQNNEEEKAENHVGHDDEKQKQKGKRKMLQDENASNDAKKHCGMRVDDENAKVCGVCLIEESKIEQGMLDCCDHFFCFGCIMEWAKVESRCPMCKQRFVTITKPGGSGKRKRTVRIPFRNQVYVPSDEQDIPLEDPYADIVCMECHDVGDEGLLLLCDRCDAAAHTFCVGLGMSVPLGDWFCRACQALIKENSDSENEEEELVLAPDADGNNGQSDENEQGEEEDSLLRSIVASPESSRNQQPRQLRQLRQTLVSSCTQSRPRSSNMLQRRRRVRSQSRRRIQRRLLGRRRERDPAVLLSQAVRAISSSHASISSSQIGSARTVPQQRRLQERIHFIRNNWGQIETGNSGVADVTMQTIDPSPVVISGMDPMEVERNKATPYEDPGESSLQSEIELKQGSQTTDYEQNLIVERNPKAPLDPCEGVVPLASYRQINSDVVDLPPSNPSSDVKLEIGGESDEMDRDKASLKNSRDRMSHDLPCYQQSNGKHKLELHKLYKCNETSDIDKSYASKTASVDAEKHVHISRARKNGVGDVGSSSQDGLKVHLTEIVKKHIWPLYLAEKLGKEQFKQIARAAVHTLLALCHLGSDGLSCWHLDADQGNSPVANCCGKCFNSHVEKAVKSAKDRVIPS